VGLIDRQRRCLPEWWRQEQAAEGERAGWQRQELRNPRLLVCLYIYRERELGINIIFAMNINKKSDKRIKDKYRRI